VLAARPAEELSGIVARLLDQLDGHFRDEELFLESIAFPGLEQHAGEHAKLLSKGLGLAGDFAAGACLPSDILGYLTYDVILIHLLGADQEFARFNAELCAAGAGRHQQDS